jgi:ParB-like chromosome segregation protein Spo0J
MPPNPAAIADRLAILPTEQVLLDPVRFQFRVATHHSTLATAERWSDDLAGVLGVWRDPADGGTYVIDGHHRHQLAARLGVPSLPVRFLSAATDQEARALGGLINIAGGTATALDAAKLLRDAHLSPEQVAAHGLPKGGRVIKEGLALSLLAPELFTGVSTGEISLAHGLALAQAGPEYVLQRDLWAHAQKRGWSAASTAEAAELSKLAAVSHRDEEGMFPGLNLQLQESNFGALLAVRAEIRKRLRGQVRALGTATRPRDSAILEAAGTRINKARARSARAQAEVAERVFAQLAALKGPLAEVVQDLARQVGPGSSPAQVVGRSLPAVRAAIQAELSG